MKNTLYKRERPYGCAPTELLNDRNISLKAKGLFAYMDSKPDTWNFTIRSMASQLKDGRDGIQGAILELKKGGYLVYEKLATGEGLYTLLYTPNPDNPDKACTENPLYGKSGRISKIDLHSKKDNIPPKDKKGEEKRTPPSPSFDWEKLLDHIKSSTGRPFRTINANTKASFRARLKDGYKKMDIYNAIINASRDPFHKDQGCKYLTPDYFSRAKSLDIYGYKPTASQKSQEQIREEGGHIVY